MRAAPLGRRDQLSCASRGSRPPPDARRRSRGACTPVAVQPVHPEQRGEPARRGHHGAPSVGRRRRRVEGPLELCLRHAGATREVPASCLGVELLPRSTGCRGDGASRAHRGTRPPEPARDGDGAACRGERCECRERDEDGSHDAADGRERLLLAADLEPGGRDREGPDGRVDADQVVLVDGTGGCRVIFSGGGRARRGRALAPAVRRRRGGAPLGVSCSGLTRNSLALAARAAFAAFAFAAAAFVFDVEAAWRVPDGLDVPPRACGRAPLPDVLARRSRCFLGAFVLWPFDVFATCAPAPRPPRIAPAVVEVGSEGSLAGCDADGPETSVASPFPVGVVDVGLVISGVVTWPPTPWSERSWSSAAWSPPAASASASASVGLRRRRHGRGGDRRLGTVTVGTVVDGTVVEMMGPVVTPPPPDPWSWCRWSWCRCWWCRSSRSCRCPARSPSCP